MPSHDEILDLWVAKSNLIFLVSLVENNDSLGFYIPCSSMIISRWFAEHERSSALAIFTNGNQVGLAISMFFTAEFCKIDFLYGWPLAFISYGEWDFEEFRAIRTKSCRVL